MNTGAKIAEVRVKKRAVYIAALAVGIPITLGLLVVDHPSEPGFDIYAPEDSR